MDVAYDGQTAIEKVQPWTDLVLLDVMLPKIDGFEVCQRIRKRVETEKIPIIFLTAKAEDHDQIYGLMMGGDDYLAKPTSMEVVVARVDAALRRAQVSEVKTLSTLGLTLYVNEYRGELYGEDLDLTLTEFELLYYLVSHPRKAYRRRELLESIWKDALMVTPRTVDAHMRNLREKIGDFSQYIETVRGVGYRFNDEVTQINDTLS